MKVNEVMAHWENATPDSPINFTFLNGISISVCCHEHTDSISIMQGKTKMMRINFRHNPERTEFYTRVLEIDKEFINPNARIMNKAFGALLDNSTSIRILNGLVEGKKKEFVLTHDGMANFFSQFYQACKSYRRTVKKGTK